MIVFFFSLRAAKVFKKMQRKKRGDESPGPSDLPPFLLIDCIWELECDDINRTLLTSSDFEIE